MSPETPGLKVQPVDRVAVQLLTHSTGADEPKDKVLTPYAILVKYQNAIIFAT